MRSWKNVRRCGAGLDPLPSRPHVTADHERSVSNPRPGPRRARTKRRSRPPTENWPRSIICGPASGRLQGGRAVSGTEQRQRHCCRIRSGALVSIAARSTPKGHEVPPRVPVLPRLPWWPGNSWGGFGEASGMPRADMWGPQGDDTAGVHRGRHRLLLRRGHFNANGQGPNMRAPGADLHYALTLGFLDAANGTARQVQLPDGRALDVKIPAGIPGWAHVIRLKGPGAAGHRRRAGGGRADRCRGGAASVPRIVPG